MDEATPELRYIDAGLGFGAYCSAVLNGHDLRSRDIALGVDWGYEAHPLTDAAGGSGVPRRGNPRPDHQGDARCDFAGRVRELSALEDAWVAAGAGEVAPVVVVYGEPGIGKTRILSELARKVDARGAEVLWGTCHEGCSERPYAVWAEAIRGCVEHLGTEGLVAAADGAVRWLTPLLPDVAVADSEHVSAAPGAARLRLAETLVQVLASFEHTPLVVLDDMQWAYPESLELLGEVARLAEGALIVVSCRGTGLELGHPLAQHLAAVQRRRPCQYVSLGSLSRREAGELLEQVVGAPLEPTLVATVYAESGGNPLFLRELGRHLHRDGNNWLAGGGRPALPQSIRAAVTVRLAGLGDDTRHVLQLASLFAAGFGFEELLALTELEEDLLLDCLDQALADELLRPVEGERYDFTHELVRQTLYESLSPSRRTRLHRRLAEALERVHGQDLGRVAGELVRQYHASASLPGAARGAPFALMAASAARSAGAPGDAVMLLRLALDLVPAQDAQGRARVLGELARAEAEAGLFEDAPRTLQAAVSSFERVGATGEEIAELVYAVGAAFTLAAAFDIVPVIEPSIAHALAIVGEKRSLSWARLKLLNRLARPQAFGPLGALRPAPFDREAIRIARSEGGEEDYAFTIDLWDPSFGDELERLITRIDEWRDPVARLRGLTQVVGHVALGRHVSSATADRLSVELCVLADDVGLGRHRAVARALRAALLGGRGELDAAAEKIAEAQALCGRRSPASPTQQLVTLVGALTAQHVAVDWRDLGGAMWELARKDDFGLLAVACAGLAAQAFAYAHDGERAREVLRHVFPALESAGPFDHGINSAIGLAGAAIWELRDKELAQRLLPLAEARADTGEASFYMTSYELTTARLSAVLGRFDQAIRRFERARVTLERGGQRVLAAIVDYDEALVRLEHQQPGATRLLAGAIARFEALGMREWSRRATALQAADRELPDRLTAREAEVLRLVARGNSNKAIAAKLIISVHTVERHVQNAYRKIRAHNRAQASSYVAHSVL